MSPQTVAIVQARMGSSRLGGKVLLDLEGKTMLERVVERIRRAAVDEVVVATTTDERDDVIVELGAHAGFPVFRGSENDVLDRFYRTATAYLADVVVRITSDCPLLDPAVAQRVIAELGRGFDYAANTIDPRTFPRGLDVEVMRFDALETAWREDKNPAWREHVTPYLYRHPERFRLGPVRNDVDLSHHRWTVDTPEDLALVRAIYAAAGPTAGLEEALAAVRAHPEWPKLNADVVQKPVLG